MDLPAVLIEKVVIRGQILHSDIFKGIDHAKFFVVIGVSEDAIAGFFFINSKINRFINTKPEQLQMQYLLYAKDYDFLAHDSYICATNVMELPKADIVRSIENKHTKVVGTLKSKHLEELLDKLRSSKLFSAITKKRYFYSANPDEN